MSIYSLDPTQEVGAGLDATKMPTNTEVDYVEVYNYNSEEDKFWLRYRDDFDTFNPKRWNKGDNQTWYEMSSTF